MMRLRAPSPSMCARQQPRLPSRRPIVAVPFGRTCEILVGSHSLSFSLSLSLSLSLFSFYLSIHLESAFRTTHLLVHLPTRRPTCVFLGTDMFKMCHAIVCVCVCVCMFVCACVCVCVLGCPPFRMFCPMRSAGCMRVHSSLTRSRSCSYTGAQPRSSARASGGDLDDEIESAIVQHEKETAAATTIQAAYVVLIHMKVFLCSFIPFIVDDTKHESEYETCKYQTSECIYH